MYYDHCRYYCTYVITFTIIVMKSTANIMIMVNKNTLGAKKWRGQEKQRLKGVI